MRLRVDSRTGAVLLTVPKRVSIARAAEWAESQGDWIARTRAAVPPPVALVPGALLPFRGEDRRIVWKEELPRTPAPEDGRILVGGAPDTLEPRILRWLRREALTLLSRETACYAEKAAVTVTRVGVGDTISRWGSCSSSGAIRYSWRLIMAPEWVLQATVAHEVAHRVHMNHGPAFHALVADLYGADPAPARDWLRKNGAALHRIGRTL